MFELELLAPAKNLDFGKSAINCGADAVYIGAPKFGARSAASNSLTSIEDLVKYAHKYHSKVYVALNTLIYDHELEDARKLIQQLWNLGADALIIQDMGIMEMDIPPISLFASTQTHNTSWQKVHFLEKAGIQRVILARELSLQQIQEIRLHTQVQLESFIHGAICVCYSGQCYLSQAIAGKSGNRGECVQPCRWEYSLFNEKDQKLISNKYLLSPKDLNLSNHLQSLIEAGITSFKIEGRLKDISYLKNTTAWYRKQLDSIINGNHNYKKASSGKPILNFEPDLSKTFNRGFTNYFIDHVQKKISSFDTPKSLGKPVAEVLKKEKDRIQVRILQNLNNGDGLCFFDKQNMLQGFRVNKAEKDFIYPPEMPDIDAGTKLFRNHDQKFETLLENTEVTRKIAIKMCLLESSDGLTLEITDEDGITSSVSIQTEKTIANQPEKAMETINNCLKKCGNTIFEVEELSVELSNAYFFPNSILNDLRRKAIETHEDLRIDSHKREEFIRPEFDFPYIDKKLDYKANVVNKNAELFYENHQAIVNERGFELLNDAQNKALMTSRCCIRFETDLCPKINKTQKAEDLFLQNGNTRLRLEFDCRNCIMKVYKA